MAIQFQCPDCKAVARVPDSASGKIGRCPKCNLKLRVPHVTPPVAAPIVEVAPAEATAARGPLLDDKSTVFVMPHSDPAPADAPVTPDSTAFEMPMFGGFEGIASAPAGEVVGDDATESSLASRLKKQQSNGAAKIMIPIALGLVLIGSLLIFMYLNREQYVGELTGTDVTSTPIQISFLAQEFGVPEDQLKTMRESYRTDPETVRTQLRTMILRGTDIGIDVTVRAGDDGRVVQVNLLSDRKLAQFYSRHKEKLEAPLLPLKTQTLSQLAQDFNDANAAQMKLGNLSGYLPTLGGDLLVGGLGYHIEAVTPAGKFPCIAEDSAGNFSFLVPRATTQFDIVPRPTGSSPNVFETDFKYTVTVPPATAAPPAATPSQASTAG